MFHEIKTARQLLGSSEAWDFSGEPTFAFTAVCWKEGDDIYHARHPERKFDLGQLVGTRIPKSHLYTKVQPNYRRAMDPLPTDSYIKRPPPLEYNQHKPEFGNNMLTEITACEVIQAHPHPNLAEYRGCICEADYVIALCFKKYKMTLSEALKEPSRLEYSVILDDVRNGVKHLHSLGLVHVGSLKSTKTTSPIRSL